MVYTIKLKKMKFPRSVSQQIRHAGTREAKKYCPVWQFIGGYKRPVCRKCRHRLLQMDCHGNPIGQREINEARIKAEKSHEYVSIHEVKGRMTNA